MEAKSCYVKTLSQYDGNEYITYSFVVNAFFEFNVAVLGRFDSAKKKNIN